VFQLTAHIERRTMLKPFDGFRSLETHHCVTGSMRHIYEFHGYPISEELLLGLGAGVGFVYWQQKGMDPFFGGRANVGRPGEEGLEPAIGRCTGVKIERFHTSSRRKAEQALRELLEAGEPVMIHVDMAFLPYFEGLPEDYHFGWHVVVVAGYDPATHQVLIADRDLELHPLEWEMLARARGSKFKPFPPMNIGYTYDFAAKRPPTPDEVRRAIRQVTHGMLEPPIRNIGVKGIRKAAAQTLKWPAQMSDERLRWTCFNVHLFIDAAGGTGGGIFRYMYGRFLDEAAGITGEARLVDVAQQFQTIGDRWQQVAAIFRQASEAPDPAALLPEATSRMEAIADLEQEAWQTLQTLVAA
jgi:hypothetical protein